MCFARFTGLFFWLSIAGVGASAPNQSQFKWPVVSSAPLASQTLKDSVPAPLKDQPAPQKIDENSLTQHLEQKTNTQIVFPHTATYTISLNKETATEEVDDANGEMTITILDAGDGWIFNQKSSLMIYYASGEVEQFITSLATWQDYTGNHYRFNYSTFRNGQEEEIIRGEAHRGANGQPGKVIYKMPNDLEIDIPNETVFPLHHLINATDKAQHGEKVVSNVVFDGTSETQEPVRVGTVISWKKPAELKLKVSSAVPAGVTLDKIWVMSFGIYPLESARKSSDTHNKEESDPEYVIKQEVFNCGVTNKMTQDYGSFQVTATLNEVNFFT